MSPKLLEQLSLDEDIPEQQQPTAVINFGEVPGMYRVGGQVHTATMLFESTSEEQSIHLLSRNGE